MKYHIVCKFLAVVLCAVFLTVAFASAAAVVCIGEAGLYGTTVQQLKAEEKQWHLEILAGRLVEQYTARELGGLTEALTEIFFPAYHPDGLTGDWYYTISSENGNLLKSNVPGQVQAESYSFWLDSSYPVILEHSVDGVVKDVQVDPSVPEEVLQEDPDATASQLYYTTRWVGYADETGKEHEYRLGMYRGPVYEVTILVTEGAFESDSGWIWQLAELGYHLRYTAIGVLFASLLLFAAALTYLCCAAGRKPGTREVCPGGLNRLPLDLYAFLVAVGAWVALVILLELSPGSDWEYAIPVAAAILATALALCLLMVGFLFALAAQIKTKKGFWWRNSLMGRVCRLCLWILKKIFSACKWVIGCIGLLPLIWQWLLTAAGMAFMVLISVLLRSPAALGFSVLACIAIVIYGSYCFGKLREGARRMSQGNLGSKVTSAALTGCFREFAEHLNVLADVAVEAGRRQMTSERMKAELITNVSHDIKTPLTSIINYVDLLQKAETEEQRGQYLEVLSRQSQRMKKLIEDLMEMSKASSGAMACELTRVDAAEAVNQALGEFADKLEEAGVVPIVRCPQTPAVMIADGRLTWRVLSNLLSNAVKYAMPGTRLYIDIVCLNGSVLISLKNISREVLNIGAEELMERFVRGDTSRNTEGSGLGLNIARSLMELQRGQLQMLIDGDLFKATMILPEAR